MKRICLLLMGTLLILTGCQQEQIHNKTVETERMAPEMTYYFPAEEEPHEGTWLTWPHEYTYGLAYLQEVESIWLEMTQALYQDETVHIITYDQTEQQRITRLLADQGIDLSKIDFVIAKSDDAWSRDTGPIFVFDENKQLTIADFAFDGWGQKAPYRKDDLIPAVVAEAKGLPIVTIADFVLEGGSIELDGAGTLMATRSAVISKNRNPDFSVEEAEGYLKQYFGVTNFIWLEGVVGEDITDGHIDGMARFVDDQTLLTVAEDDFYELYEGIKASDYALLQNAKNATGQPYKLVALPLTAQNVLGLDYKGSYLNYYVANATVLAPVYNDLNDDLALGILGKLYPDRKIIPIDVTALYQYGGMIHCVTQQQPQLF